MKPRYKILFFTTLTLALAGVLFFETNQALAGRCECCYSRVGDVSTRSNCEAYCRDYGDWRYFASGDPATTGEYNPTVCLPPTGMCWCCWTDAPEAGYMEQSACIAACTDTGGVKTFRSTVTSLNLSRECLARPSEEGSATGTPVEEPSSTLPTLGEPTGVLAGGLQKAAGRAGYQSTSIEGIVSNLIYILLGFVGVIFLILTIYAGAMWMMARGNEQEIEKAKATLERAAIGLIIVFAAYAITYFVTSRLIGETPSATSSCPAGEVDCTAVCTSGYPSDLCAPDAGSCVCP